MFYFLRFLEDALLLLLLFPCFFLGGASLQRIQNVLLVCVQIHVSPAAKLLNILNPSEVFPIKCPGSVIWNVFLKFFVLDVVALKLPKQLLYTISFKMLFLGFVSLNFISHSPAELSLAFTDPSLQWLANCWCSCFVCIVSHHDLAIFSSSACLHAYHSSLLLLRLLSSACFLCGGWM